MSLSSLASTQTLRIHVIRCDEEPGLGFAGLFQVLRLAAIELGEDRLLLDVATAGELPDTQADLILLVADEELAAGRMPAVQAHCRKAGRYGAVGAVFEWLKERGEIKNDGAQLYDLEHSPLTCCGGAAAIDFALALVKACFGEAVQAAIMETLCVTQVRAPDVPRPQARQRLQPVLAEALRLMETHIEEPLNSDDIANLVGISRRQLERLFKQHLGNMPARYYLEMRLQHARNLLLESHHSIVQVGLMCGFSSGAHFATAYGTLFGITPREERQRKIALSRN
ncbi:MAG: helix-turn-helix domain-containing protein [Burkholderiaceae bacterium]|nr:helix-turn-helix domain-containing protein [Burkholderiaceae bacterium]